MDRSTLRDNIRKMVLVAKSEAEAEQHELIAFSHCGAFVD